MKILTAFLLLGSLNIAKADAFNGTDYWEINRAHCAEERANYPDRISFCNTKTVLSYTTSFPTVMYGDNELEMGAPETVDALISESLDINSKKEVTTQVADHLELSVVQVVNAVLALGETGEVSIENITIFYK